MATVESSTLPANVLLPLESQEAARAAGLRYVSADTPGIRRLKRGSGWVFIKPDGQVLKDRCEIERIKSLVIPPAWTNVWICPFANGHLQAVGLDQRGRKQYRYHAEYRSIRDATKFTRMAAFGAALPQIRARIEEDLRLRGLGREKVVATAVRLLEETSVRVGNEEYAKQNDSFGLTTLRDHHVEIEGKTMKFRFKGKSAQEHDIELNDARLAKIVQACQDIPGQELFQFYDPSGEHCRLCSEDVNRYIKEIGGDDFTAKDFRTWNGSREAVLILNEMGPATSATDAKKRIVETVKRVAAKLRNRPATCRKYYIHPAVLEAYQDNTLFEFVEQAKPQEGPYGLDRNEVALLSIIQMNVPKELMRKRRRAA